MIESKGEPSHVSTNRDEELVVLVAETGGFLRSLHDEILNAEFTTVGPGTTGVEALELFKEKKPDVVLLKQDLSIRDGPEVAQEIKSIDRHVGIIILCVSRNLSVETIESEFVDGIVTMPYQKPALIYEVEQVAQTQ